MTRLRHGESEEILVTAFAIVCLILMGFCAGFTAPRPSADIPSSVRVPGPETAQPRTGAPSSLEVDLGGPSPSASGAPKPSGGIGLPAHATNPKLTPPPEGVTGTATWFDAPWGTAAAGPALRDYLGSDWRGKRVSVTAPGCGCPAVVVLLDDWCLCRDDRVIDLNRAAFANLAMPSKGVIRVIVREEP